MSFEQHKEEKKQLAILNNPASSDLEKGYAASKLSNGIWGRGDYAQSLSYGIIAEQFFKKVNDPLNMADAIYHQGMAQFSLEAYSDALERFDAAAALFRSELNQHFLACAVERKAACLEELDQPQQAASNYIEAALLFQSAHSHLSAGNSYRKAATQLLQIGEYEQAELNATLAIESYSAQQDDCSLAEGYGVLGNALLEQENYDAAIENFLAGISIHKYVEDPAERASLHYDLALAYFKSGRFDEARFALEQAKAAYSEVSQNHMQAVCDLLLARVEFATGNAAGAAALLDQCRTLIKFANADLWFICDYIKAQVSMVINGPEQSLPDFERAEKTFESIKKFIPEAAEFWLLYAEALLATPQNSRALEVLNNIDFVEKLEPIERTRYYATRARAHLLASQHTQALEVVDIALDAIAGDTQHQYLASVLETKARVLTETGNLDEGLPAIQNAINSHLISGSVDAARYLALELRNLSDPKRNAIGDPTSIALWSEDEQAA